MTGAAVLRTPAEITYAQELALLAQRDQGSRPPGWKLSPLAVRQFILGTDGVAQKFYGDAALVDRCIVTLMSNRGLLLVGEPGTAKSMLSELLSAAISGDSTITVQGTAGLGEEQIRYTWNYALLLAEGPSPRALVPGPLYKSMQRGALLRFEELTRVQSEIQDSLISILSDKVLHVPELRDADSTVFAERGFNVIATANLRDRGVNEMSSALKRRFNFETVRPLSDRQLEAQLIRQQTGHLLREAEVALRLPDEVIEVLVTTFNDLRHGQTAEGTQIERPSAVMSTAEAVAVGFAAGLDAHYFANGQVRAEHVARQLIGTVLKDNPDDIRKLRHYFDVVVKQRAKNSDAWQSYHHVRRQFDV